MNDSDKVRFFRRPKELRRWFEKNHQTARMQWIGFHKKKSGRPSITWPESVDEALCFGWIDGIRKRIDENSYKIRFTPRKEISIWSAINITRCQELAAEGRVEPAGLAAFKKRKANRSGIHAYEQRPQELPEPYRSLFEKSKLAWAYFRAQPPYYTKLMTWWVISAKQETTRLQRLQRLVQASARKIRL